MAEVKRGGMGGIPWGGWLLFILTSAALWFGWSIRDERYITAEYGLGYALGIVGGSLMLLLLLYPLRKHWRRLHRAGPIHWWFRIHMLFGLLGPLAVLYHANFHQGSLNSTVALWAMLIVSASGVVGRLIYTRIHYGLYGSRMTLQGLRSDSAEGRAEFVRLCGELPEVEQALAALEGEALKPSRGVLQGLWRRLRVGFVLRRTRRRVTPRLLVALAAQGGEPKAQRSARKALKRALRGYFASVYRVARLALFERLFAWWHVLHLPLFLLLVVSGITHVVAVHRY